MAIQVKKNVTDTETAEIFAKLIWTPRNGDKVYLTEGDGKKTKDEIVAYNKEHKSVFLKSDPIKLIPLDKVSFRPSSRDYMEIIQQFIPIVRFISVTKTGHLMVNCKSGPFPFAVRGRPKQVLAKLLNTRLHLMEVNNRVNEIMNESRGDARTQLRIIK